MFRWDFAKSAETVFSRWAIKRVCKFLLKKKLADFILGDIDLDQLDVQLSRGTIQLSDLALNVDYINQKLTGGALVVKEGSISSLSIRIPWKLQNCQIELEELELVLSPFNGCTVQGKCNSSVSSRVDMSRHVQEQIDPGTGWEAHLPASVDIHDGVKTIAKIVKWFLTSFHVRLKNLIIAFDPSLDVDENILPVNKSLVLRIAETEFGTCLSEDIDKAPLLKSDCLLGMAKLTNFMKFQGAVIEILTMQSTDNRSHALDSLESNYSTSSLLLGSTAVILTGRMSGFSGRLNLAIPWKNGSLDFQKVDANVFLDPIELRLQPSTIEWIVVVWDSLISAGTAASSCVHFNTKEFSHSSSRFYNNSNVSSSSILGADAMKPSNSNVLEKLHSGIYEEKFLNDTFTRTHVIQDWVPLAFKEDQEELEQDYGKSIDQFFECFDGLRSSESNSGNSGLWNWTYSVFNAISVASNLASGSGHALKEQQHVETCLRATVAGFSLIVNFIDKEDNLSDQLAGCYKNNDEFCQLGCASSQISNLQDSLNEQSFLSYMSCFSSMNVDQSALSEPNPTGLKIHRLEAKCLDVEIDYQVGPRNRNCQISIRHAKVDEYYDHKSQGRMFALSDDSSPYAHMIINNRLKENVYAALSPFSEVYNSKAPSNAEISNENASCQDDLMKVGIIEFLGTCSFHCVVKLADSDGCSVLSTSFSVHLPPCNVWFHFHLAISLLNLFNKVESYFARSRSSKTRDLETKFTSTNDMLNDNSSGKIIPSRENVQGDIIFSHTRIIICFPLHGSSDFTYLYPIGNFLILEHSPLLFVEEVLKFSPTPSKHPNANGNSCIPAFSIHFVVGTFDIYMIDPIRKDADMIQSMPLYVKEISVVKVASATNRIGGPYSGIRIVWQKGPVTGPWMASRIWGLASAHNHRSTNKINVKNCEFSSVTAVEDLGEINADVYKDLLLSSAFLLYIHVSVLSFNLTDHYYRLLNGLLDVVVRGFSNGAYSKLSAVEEQPLCKHDMSQINFNIHCDLLDLSFAFDEVPHCSNSVQKELEGSWNCFKLTVENFEIMSVSNVGGIHAAEFFLLNHGEGELWSSIYSGSNTDAARTQDFLLISCKNSARRRGGGDGVNLLSFGSAGTTITYVCNPQAFSSYTSVLVRCATIFAPGGRFDWISVICLFFSLPSDDKSLQGDQNHGEPSSDCIAYQASFFLDLVDSSLSYEPHRRHPSGNSELKCIGCDDTFEFNDGISEQLVCCILAIASVSLSNQMLTSSETTEYHIQIKDAGLLIGESSGPKNDYCSYDVSYLQRSGYAKIASLTLLEAILKINGLQWEVDCSDSHISFDTCHDTAHGLLRLISQVQQLFAPDIEDALAHLQSRWNNVQQSYNPNGSNDVLDNSVDSIDSGAGKKLPGNDGNSIGLLDEIMENVFHIGEEPNHSFNGFWMDSSDCGRSAHNCKVENACSESNSALDITKKVSRMEQCFPEIIDGYCLSELMAPSIITEGSISTDKDQRSIFDIPARAYVEYGNGGWYKDGDLMLVEDHIPNHKYPDSDEHHREDNSMPVDFDAFAHCSYKVRILLKNIEIRWRMFAGSDWYKLMKLPAGRDASVSLELGLSGLSILYILYPEGKVNVSKLSIYAQDFHLYDKSTNAPWKMVIGPYNNKGHPRESYAKALKLDLETVRPDPATPLEDYRLCLEFLPIRVHLDQSQIHFLIRFFGSISSITEPHGVSDEVGRLSIADRKSKIYDSQTFVEEALLPFFQKCDVKPLVVRIDYIPHHLDLAALKSGNYVELLNLVPWKGIDLDLKHVCAIGVYGWGSVCETVIGQWLEDISHNQVHKLLKGLAPIRSFVSVASGTSKLVTLPVKSYRRDKKLLKGIQRGAIAFVKSISLEAVGLGMHLAAGAHEILLQTEYVLANIPLDNEKGRTKKITNTNQPGDAQEGIWQAYESLADGLSRTASAMLGAPIKEYQRGAGAGLALATAIRAAPAAAIAPVTASARAMHCALVGMRNSLNPDHKKESIDKYLGPSRS